MGYLPIGGGGLNASYTTVDFIWAYQGYDDEDDECVTLMVKDEKYESFLHLALQNNHRIKHTDKGDVKLTKEAQ